jgi:hypothetical protein
MMTLIESDRQKLVTYYCCGLMWPPYSYRFGADPASNDSDLVYFPFEVKHLLPNHFRQYARRHSVTRVTAKTQRSFIKGINAWTHALTVAHAVHGP